MVINPHIIISELQNSNAENYEGSGILPYLQTKKLACYWYMVLTKDMRLGQRQRILSSWQSEQQHDQDIVSSFCPLPHPKFHRGKRWAYILGWDTGEEQYGEFIVFILSNKQTCSLSDVSRVGGGCERIDVILFFKVACFKHNPKK